jgi:hypothetical protein
MDRRFAVHAVLWTVASFLAFGLVSAIVPNPVFGRQIPAEPFAIAVWILSAPLMGLVLATYTTPLPSVGTAGPSMAMSEPAVEGRGTTLGAVAALGAFLAIGCPVCNKVALVLLGTSGALTIFAPIQPVIGAVSLGLLMATLAWRLRGRTRPAACAIPVRDGN